MSRRKDGQVESEVVRIRLAKDVLEECREAHKAGAQRHNAESTFLGYLVELGIKRYKNAILPMENGDDDRPSIQKNETLKEANG